MAAATLHAKLPACVSGGREAILPHQNCAKVVRQPRVRAIMRGATVKRMRPLSSTGARNLKYSRA